MGDEDRNSSWKSRFFRKRSQVELSEKERELTAMYVAALSAKDTGEETTEPLLRLGKPTGRQYIAGDIEHFLSNSELIDLDDDDEVDESEEEDDGYLSEPQESLSSSEAWEDTMDIARFDNEEAVRTEEYYATADGILQAIAESSQAARRAHSPQAIGRIKAMRQVLLEQQAAVVDRVKTCSKELSKALSRHATALRKRLRWIMERGLRRSSSQAANNALLTEAQAILEELKATSKEGKAALLDHYFPTQLDWKLRLGTGDGSFIGVRDVDIDALSADLTLSIKKPNHGRTSMEVHAGRINATVTVFDFQIKGSNLRAKFSKLLLTPTINCLRLTFTGDYTLVLDYERGMERNNYQPRWRENRRMSSLKNLHISKQMSGVSALQLPHKLVESLATSLLPSAINDYVMKAFRPEMAEVIQRNEDRIEISASLRVHQQLSSMVWRAPLASNTDSARQARQAVGLDYQECAWLDFLMRTKAAHASGFDKKGISLHRLFRWRREFAGHSLDALHPLILALQANVTPRKDPSVLVKLLLTVEKLAAKTIRCSVSINKLRVNVGLEAAFKRIRERQLAEFVSIHADTAAERQFARLRRNRVESMLRDLESQFRTQVLPYLGSNTGLTMYGEIEGGLENGQFMMLSDDFKGIFRLPPYFTMNDIFGQPPIHHEGDEFVLAGRFNPPSGAYVVCIRPRSLNPSQDGASASFKGLNIQVSPAQHPGFIMLSTAEVKCTSSTLILAELSESFMYTNDNAQEANVTELFEASEQVQHSRIVVSNCRDQYNQSRKRLAELSHAGSKEEGTRPFAAEDYSHPFIPRLLIDPAYSVTVGYENVRVDVVKEDNNSDNVQLVIATNHSSEGEKEPVRISVVSTLQSILQRL